MEIRATAGGRLGVSAAGLVIVAAVVAGCGSDAGGAGVCVQGTWTQVAEPFWPEQADHDAGVGSVDVEVLTEDSAMRAGEDVFSITQRSAIEYRTSAGQEQDTKGWTTIEGNVDLAFTIQGEVLTISEATDAEGVLATGSTSGTNPEMTSELPYADYAQYYVGDWRLECDGERMTWTALDENAVIGEVTYLRD